MKTIFIKGAPGMFPGCGRFHHLEALLPLDTAPYFSPALNYARSDALMAALSQGMAALFGDFLPPESPGNDPP